jgi:hypothetical protein
MIDLLPNVTPGGAPNPQQVQARMDQANDDIRTNNGEQLETHKVEQPQDGSAARFVGQDAREGKKPVPDEPQDKKGGKPPEPSRFERTLEARRKKANDARDEITQFLLDVAKVASSAPSPSTLLASSLGRLRRETQIDALFDTSKRGVDIII